MLNLSFQVLQHTSLGIKGGHCITDPEHYAIFRIGIEQGDTKYLSPLPGLDWPWVLVPMAYAMG